MKNDQPVEKNGMSDSPPVEKEGQKRQLFGTDGVRGVANLEPMTSEMALKLGRALAYVFREPERAKRTGSGEEGVGFSLLNGGQCMFTQ